MITLLSPAKKMSTAPHATIPMTTPRFRDEADGIAHELASWSPDQVAHEMGVSSRVAEQTVQLYQHYDDALLSPAALSYSGIAYKYLEAGRLSAEDISRLYICSTLYGLLAGTDAIVPYRLEGKVTLHYAGGQRLYDYWRGRVTEALMQILEHDPDHTLLFTASQEMTLLMHLDQIAKRYRVITPIFVRREGQKLRQVTTYAKMMRGHMAHSALLHQWHGTVEEMQAFADEEDMELIQDQQHPLDFTFVLQHIGTDA